jgi:hypothetical protein
MLAGVHFMKDAIRFLTNVQKSALKAIWTSAILAH